MIRIKKININNPVTGELQEQLCGSVSFARENFESEISKIKTMKVKITKLKELEDALHPNNIETGYETIRKVDEKYFEEPQVGQRFNIGTFSTSAVQEIIDKNTFRTYSSIYRWEVVS